MYSTLSRMSVPQLQSVMTHATQHSHLLQRIVHQLLCIQRHHCIRRLDGRQVHQQSLQQVQVQQQTLQQVQVQQQSLQQNHNLIGTMMTLRSIIHLTLRIKYM